MTDEVINGYRLTEPFQNKDAGFCKWTFAQKNGELYFIKQFMDPIYPQDPTLSEQIRQYKIEDCKFFETEKKKICIAINTASDGNLVRITELFRSGSHYYLTMPAMVRDIVKLSELTGYSFEDRVFLCRSVAHSIACLHKKRFVHTDIKPSNVILKRTINGKITGKIIDFDSGFFEVAPPKRADELEGDLTYLAPESCLFMNDMDAELSCKLDVFSLGILFHLYLAGFLPEFDHEKFESIFETVLEGGAITISDKIPEELADMLRRMLICEPKNRISSQEVYEILNSYLTVPSDNEENGATAAGKCNGARPDANGSYFKKCGDLRLKEVL